MAVDLSFMIGGEAGQGIQSMSFVLGKTLMRGGYEVFISQDFESRIRGGHSSARVRSCRQADTGRFGEVDILIALNAETIDIHRKDLDPAGVIICDRERLKIGETES